MLHGAVIIHSAAAWVYGFDPRTGARLEFSTNTGTTTAHTGVILHRRQSTIAPDNVDSLPVTGPDRTFVDCCHRLGFVKCVQLADNLVRLMLPVARLPAVRVNKPVDEDLRAGDGRSAGSPGAH